MAGDEVYGGNPKLRTVLEERGTGYVLAVARTHEVTTHAGKFRADVLVKKLPKRAWQRLSAGNGAKGQRFYDWAHIALLDPRAGHRHLLIRRNRTTGELAYYRCYSPQPVPLTTLVRVAGSRWSIEETFQAGKGLAGLDEHQVRRYTSWTRWVTLAMLAHAFLAVLRADEDTHRPAPDTLIPLTCNEIARLFIALVAERIHDTAPPAQLVPLASPPPSPIPSQPPLPSSRPLCLSTLDHVSMKPQGRDPASRQRACEPYHFTAVVRGNVIPLEPELLKDTERRCVPRADGRPEPFPPGRNSGIEHRAGRLGGVATPMRALEQLIRDLRLLYGGAADDQPAIADEVAFVTALDGQQGDPRCRRRGEQLRDGRPGVLNRGRPVAAFGEEGAELSGVRLGPRPQYQPLGLKVERHRLVRRHAPTLPHGSSRTTAGVLGAWH